MKSFNNSYLKNGNYETVKNSRYKEESYSFLVFPNSNDILIKSDVNPFYKIMGFISYLLLFLSISVSAQINSQSELSPYLSGLPFEMPEMKVPQFPEKTYNILDFGAVSDGHTLNTNAFEKAIQKCTENGGGKIIVPSGFWYTGPIQLKSNVNLHLEKGALILFSKNHADYPIIKLPHRGVNVASPIYGYDLENIAITGEGIFDGSGETWRPVKKSKMTKSQWNDLIKSGGVVDEKNSIWWPSNEAMEGEQYINELKAKKDEPL